MLLPGKFVTACVALGGFGVLSSGLLQTPPAIHGAAPASLTVQSSGVSSVSSYIASICHQADTQLTPQIASLAHTSEAFIGKNATTARLQFEGMANSVSGRMSLAAWLPQGATFWWSGNTQTAIQNANSQAANAAGKIPAVRAVRANIDHLSSLHPALSLTHGF